MQCVKKTVFEINTLLNRKMEVIVSLVGPMGAKQF